MIKQVFEGLDASQKRVRKIATIDPIRKKIILIQPGDKVLYQSGLREKGVAGYVYVFAHATAKSIQGMIHAWKWPTRSGAAASGTESRF